MGQITFIWICVWGKLGQWNHVIIVTSSFTKSFVFYPQLKVQPLLSSSSGLKIVFGKHERPNQRNKTKVVFLNSYGVVWAGRKFFLPITDRECQVKFYYDTKLSLSCTFCKGETRYHSYKTIHDKKTTDENVFTKFYLHKYNFCCSRY